MTPRRRPLIGFAFWSIAHLAKMPSMTEWPEWWHWPLIFIYHLLKRMVDRGFSQTDLRLMLEDAAGYHEDVEPGRWVIETFHHGRPWEVIVEPLSDERLLLVVTAYPLG